MERLTASEIIYRQRHRNEFIITGLIAAALVGFLLGLFFHTFTGL